MRNSRATQLLFELSKPGLRAAVMPACDVPEKPVGELLPAGAVALRRPERVAPAEELLEPGEELVAT